MKPASLAFLKRLLDAPGPSGFETLPARVWRTEAEQFADSVTSDVTGNSLAAVNPDGSPRVMFAGHIDEIGLMVVHVDDEGYLYFSTIGGWDAQVLVGQRVIIMAKSGPVEGVIGKKAIHLIKQDERDKVSKPSDLWIDIGAADKKDALKRIRVGDPAVLASVSVEFPNGRLVSRSIDNRIGAFVVLEALRLLSKKKPKTGAFAVATVQEEIAWAGGGARVSAVHIAPKVALVVDVTHATDHPGVEKKEVGDFKLGGGPVLSRGSVVNPVVFDMLVETADEEKIPYTIQAAPRDTGTDADAIYTASHGIATGLISVPNRYMHSPNEMVDLADLERVSQLLAAFTRKVTEKTDFTPR
jgi:putative aminopeptidase FrvX